MSVATMSADAHGQDVIAAQWSPAAFGWVATRNDRRPYRPAPFHLLMAKAMIELEQHRLDALLMSIPVRRGLSRSPTRAHAHAHLKCSSRDAAQANSPPRS
jgi:hypothetical protein